MQGRVRPGRAVPTEASGPVTLGKRRVLGRVGPSPGSALPNAFTSSGHRIGGPLPTAPHGSCTERSSQTVHQRSGNALPRDARTQRAGVRRARAGLCARSSSSVRLRRGLDPRAQQSPLHLQCHRQHRATETSQSTGTATQRVAAWTGGVGALCLPWRGSTTPNPTQRLSGLSYWQEGGPAPVPGPATRFLPHTTACQFYLCPSPCIFPRGDSGTPRASPPPRTHLVWVSAGLSQLGAGVGKRGSESAR